MLLPSTTDSAAAAAATTSTDSDNLVSDYSDWTPSSSFRGTPSPPPSEDMWEKRFPNITVNAIHAPVSPDHSSDSSSLSDSNAVVAVPVGSAPLPPPPSMDHPNATTTTTDGRFASVVSEVSMTSSSSSVRRGSTFSSSSLPNQTFVNASHTLVPLAPLMSAVAAASNAMAFTQATVAANAAAAAAAERQWWQITKDVKVNNDTDKDNTNTTNPLKRKQSSIVSSNLSSTSLVDESEIFLTEEEMEARRYVTFSPIVLSGCGFNTMPFAHIARSHTFLFRYHSFFFPQSERNRAHAKKSRMRKKCLTTDLQESLESLREENEKLREFIYRRIGQGKTNDILSKQKLQSHESFIAALQNPANKTVDSKTNTFLRGLRKNVFNLHKKTKAPLSSRN